MTQPIGHIDQICGFCNERPVALYRGEDDLGSWIDYTHYRFVYNAIKPACQECAAFCYECGELDCEH